MRPNEEKVISHKVFAGNLSFDISRDELLEVFGTVGPVVDVNMPIDRMTGRPRGFAFVEYETEEDALKAIDVLNGKEVSGRKLRIDEARERQPRLPREPDFSFPPGGGGKPFKSKGSRRNIRKRKRGF